MALPNTYGEATKLMSARVGISLIGTPDGFEAASIGASKAVNIGRKVDLDNSVINILPNTDILAIRRDVEGSRLLTHVTYYRFAKEIKTSRTGSFYGSSILFDSFIPNRISFVYKLLVDLAERVGKFCINESENRFHSHINPALLDVFDDNKELLTPVTYGSGSNQPPRRMYDRRCFLSLDRSLPNYEDFLYEVLISDPQSPTSLPGYRFVYTSTHNAVIEEVKLRKGLKIETLATLRESYLRESPSQEETPRTQPRKEDLATAPNGLPLASTPSNDPTSDVLGAEQSLSNKLTHAFNPSQEVRGDSKNFHDEPAEKSRVVIQLASETPQREGTFGEEAQRRETLGEQTQDPDPPDGHLVALARWVEHPFRTRRDDGKSLVSRFGRIGLILASIILAAVLGAVFLLPLLARAWSWITGDSRDYMTNAIYYDGCRKTTDDAYDLSAPPLECQPQYVADEFERLLMNCEPYKDHLSDLLKSSGQRAVNDYRDSIRNRILRSIEDPKLGNRLTGRGDTTSLSRTVSTGFVVDLDFDNSQPCLDSILNDRSSDFTTRRTAPTPSPTAAPEVPPQKNKTPTSVQVQPAQTPPPRRTPTPMMRPSPIQAPPPGPTPTPVKADTGNQNANNFKGTLLDNQNSGTDVNQKATPAQTQPDKPNGKHAAPRQQEEQPKTKRGKKGGGTKPRT